jgi:hypothetical protein
MRVWRNLPIKEPSSGTDWISGFIPYADPIRDPVAGEINAAFQQAAKKVLQRARQTGTPIVIWEAVGMPGFIEMLQISL